MSENKSEIKNARPVSLGEAGENEKNSFRQAIKRIVDSIWFKRSLFAILALIILAAVFDVGIRMGYRRANFSYQWGENYHRVFGGPRGGIIPMPRGFRPNEGFINNPHGASGAVLKIDGNSVIIKGDDNIEKTILVSDKTIIRNGNQTIKISDLKAGELIVVIGNPNNFGQIEASFIRIFQAAD